MNQKFKLYKYKALQSSEQFSDFDGFEREQYYLMDFLNQKIWFRAVKDLNDPFEGGSKSVLTCEEILRNPQLRDHMFKAYKRDGHCSSLTEFEKLLTDKDFQDSLKKDQEQPVNLFSEHGVFCLTQNASNIPMWAHYAHEHTGYCLIFEVNFDVIYDRSKIELPKEIFANSVMSGENIISFHDDEHEFVFTKVKYQETPPCVSISQHNNLYQAGYGKAALIEYVVQNSIGVKYSQWNYEEEFRLIANTSGLASLPRYVPFLRITGIIVGINMPRKIKQKICELCAQKNIEFYQAKKSNREYKIEIEKSITVENLSTNIPEITSQ